MRNFIYAYYLWTPVAIGIVRGIKIGTRRAKVIAEFEDFVERATHPKGITHIDDTPIKEHPNYLVVIKARDEIVKRVRGGKYAHKAEIYSDFETEVEFQFIVANVSF